MEKIRIGIAGYGNLGRGVEFAVNSIEDMCLIAVFTRREPESIKTMSDTPVVSMNDIESYKNKIDVMILCGGSATDLPVQGPAFAKNFCTIDSFDNHAKIPEYFEKMDKILKESQNAGIISVGWDPGLFSLNRVMSSSILPDGENYTFWGRGISQGHSDAIRRIEGVKNAKQYTIPVEEAIEKVRSGSNPVLSARQKHLRECFVVLEEGASAEKVKDEIISMPNYFADYDTNVHFISEEELKENHSGMPHGGFVLRTGKSASGSAHVIEYSLKLESNPDFTSSVLTAYARAVYRMRKSGLMGAYTVFDVAPALLSPKSAGELRATLL
jgi:diaminopimelate dehydrogenase